MRTLRLASVGALLALVAAPVPRVYTASTPKIGKFMIIGNDLKEVWGTGLPGSQVQVHYRQRGFAEDDNIQWCNWNNNGNWLGVGPNVYIPVASDGTWKLQNVDVMVRPSEIKHTNCAAALFTEFRVVVQGQPLPTGTQPQLLDMEVLNPGPTNRWVDAGVRYADQVAVAIADGPDMPGTEHPGEDDTDEDGVDLCNTYGLTCGQTVTWRHQSGGTFTAPAIIEDDGSVFGIPNVVDAEYNFVVAMVQAHKPSFSFLAIATLPRSNAYEGPALNINVDVDVDFALSCGNSFFDFFK